MSTDHMSSDINIQRTQTHQQLPGEKVCVAGETRGKDYKECEVTLGGDGGIQQPDCDVGFTGTYTC